jgi:hypothetical protein
MNVKPDEKEAGELSEEELEQAAGGVANPAGEDSRGLFQINIGAKAGASVTAAPASPLVIKPRQ